MDLFDGPKSWSVTEQIVTDPATGLTIQFEVLPSGYRALRIFGDLPFGNREIIFDDAGQEAGAATDLRGGVAPAWHVRVSP